MRRKAAAIAQIVDNVRRMFQAIHVHSRRAKRMAGLTGPQLWAIRVIAQSAPINVSDLSRRMYLHPTTVVGILDRLEGGGFIQRMRSRVDRRVVHVELTAAGLDLVKNSPAVVQGLLISGLESLSVKNLTGISESMETLVGVLGASGLPPKLLLSDEVNVSRGLRGPKTKGEEGGRSRHGSEWKEILRAGKGDNRGCR